LLYALYKDGVVFCIVPCVSLCKQSGDGDKITINYTILVLLEYLETFVIVFPRSKYLGKESPCPIGIDARVYNAKIRLRNMTALHDALKDYTMLRADLPTIRFTTAIDTICHGIESSHCTDWCCYIFTGYFHCLKTHGTIKAVYVCIIIIIIIKRDRTMLKFFRTHYVSVHVHYKIR